MSRAEFLFDTSALARAHQPAVADQLAAIARRGAAAISGPVLFEVAYSATSDRHRTDILDSLAAFTGIDTVEADHRRALEVQGLLTTTAQHRGLSLVDALVAATAERVGLSVLHYDRDFEKIARVTGQEHTWVVPRGSAD